MMRSKVVVETAARIRASRRTPRSESHEHLPRAPDRDGKLALYELSRQAHDAPPRASERPVPPRIRRRAASVPRPVHLHDQLDGQSGEVRDMLFDPILPAKE